jgi:hypothetical protein
MKKKQPDSYNEPPISPDSEITDYDLEQVTGGFDPQPDPPAIANSVKTNPCLLLPAVNQKKLKTWGDPH